MLEAVLGSVVETGGSTAIVEAWLGASWAPLGSLKIVYACTDPKAECSKAESFASTAWDQGSMFAVDMGTPDIVLNSGICWGARL